MEDRAMKTVSEEHLSVESRRDAHDTWRLLHLLHELLGWLAPPMAATRALQHQERQLADLDNRRGQWLDRLAERVEQRNTRYGGVGAGRDPRELLERCRSRNAELSSEPSWRRELLELEPEPLVREPETQDFRR